MLLHISAIILSTLLYSLAVLPLSLKRHWKILLLFPVFGAGCKTQILHVLGGREYFFGPDVPGWMIGAGGWVYGIFMLFLLFLLAAWLVHLVWLLVLKIRKAEISAVFNRNWNIVHGVLLVLAVVCSSIGLWRGTMSPAVRDVTVALPGKSQTGDLKIVLLADIHADRLTRADRIRQFVEKANGAGGDVIVIAGDMFDGHAITELLPLKELHAPYGVYAVPGNHEYISGYPAWKEFMERELPNIILLENRHDLLPDGTVLAGITDPAAGRNPLEPFELPDAEKALDGSPEKARKIVISHQPKTARKVSESGADLQLSGHTHGGMIIGMDLAVKFTNGGYLSGLYDVNGMQLYVSPGTGIWNGFPIRLGHDAEITRITVKGTK